MQSHLPETSDDPSHKARSPSPPSTNPEHPRAHPDAPGRARTSWLDGPPTLSAETSPCAGSAHKTVATISYVAPAPDTAIEATAPSRSRLDDPATVRFFDEPPRRTERAAEPVFRISN